MGNSGSSHILAEKEVIREQSTSNWKIASTTSLLSMIIKFITWPLIFFGNKVWNYTTQRNEYTNIENDKTSEDKAKDNITSDTNSDQTDNKGSPVPGAGGPFNKSSKKNKNKNIASNKKKPSTTYIKNAQNSAQ